MAWEFVNLSDTIMSSTCNDAHLTSSGVFASGTLPEDFVRNPIYKSEWESVFPANTFMAGDTSLGLQYTGSAINAYKNNSIFASIDTDWDWADSQSHNNIIYIAAIDRTREVGTLIVYKRYYGLEDTAWDAPPYTNTYLQNNNTLMTETHDAYLLLLNFVQVSYSWSSVQSITGKNGAISLAQIASGSINDGEPVSDAAATAFSDLPAECNVGEIIDELLPYEESLVDVLVKYKVKGAVTGAFEYVKLVAKKGSIPKSVEDGDKVVDINPSKKSKLVIGLDEGSKYYFVIFEKDTDGNTANSEPKDIVTGEIIGEPIEILLDADNQIISDTIRDITTWCTPGRRHGIWDFNNYYIYNTSPQDNIRAMLNHKFVKGRATNIIVEVESTHSNQYGQNWWLHFALTNDYNEIELYWDDTRIKDVAFIDVASEYNIIDNDPWYDLPKTVIAISLSDIPSNQVFYLTWASCDLNTKIHKIYFDDTAYIVD